MASRKSGAPVILSNDYNRFVATLIRAIQCFEQVNSDIVGAILNQANPREESYYGHDYYYNYYRSEAQQPNPSQYLNTQRPLIRIKTEFEDYYFTGRLDVSRSRF